MYEGNCFIYDSAWDPRPFLKIMTERVGARSLFLRRPRSEGIIRYNAFFQSRSLLGLLRRNRRLLLRNNDLQFHLKSIIENNNSRSKQWKMHQIFFIAFHYIRLFIHVSATNIVNNWSIISHACAIIHDNLTCVSTIVDYHYLEFTALN